MNGSKGPESYKLAKEADVIGVVFSIYKSVSLYGTTMRKIPGDEAGGPEHHLTIPPTAVMERASSRLLEYKKPQMKGGLIIKTVT